MFDKPQPPPAPDPEKVAAASQATNRATAVTQAGLNSTNQVTPYGNLTYSQSGTWEDGTPRFTATQSLSPEQQELYRQYTENQRKLGVVGGQQIEKIGGILGTPFDVNTAATNQQYDLARKLLDPQWNQREEALKTELANKGIDQGNAAWTNAYRDFGMGRDQAYNSAMLASRGQAVTEALANRNQPINEITALQSGSQVSQPNFVGTPQTNVAPTDYLGAVGLQQQGLQNAYNQQMGQQNAIYGALGSMAGTIGGVALGKWGGFKP